VCNFATPNFGAGMLKRDRARESGEIRGTREEVEEIKGVRREENRERRDH
jgi:hypothetical protein